MANAETNQISGSCKSSIGTRPYAGGDGVIVNSKADYTKLDELIKQKISSGKRTFAAIDGGEVAEEAKIIASISGGEAYRVIDRRLQALRKSGVINYGTTTKWTIS